MVKLKSRIQTYNIQECVIGSDLRIVFILILILTLRGIASRRGGRRTTSGRTRSLTVTTTVRWSWIRFLVTIFCARRSLFYAWFIFATNNIILWQVFFIAWFLIFFIMLRNLVISIWMTFSCYLISNTFTRIGFPILLFSYTKLWKEKLVNVMETLKDNQIY